MTLEQIAIDMLEDPSCDESGWTVQGRVDYIMTVMRVDSISMHECYDFSHVPECADVAVVHAAGHLASIQMEFFGRAHAAGIITDDKYVVLISQLQLDINKISWHAAHLMRNERTPPYFPFIN